MDNFDEVFKQLEESELDEAQLIKLHKSAAIKLADIGVDWIGEDAGTIVIGNNVFPMRFKGKRQLEVIDRLRTWLREYVAEILGSLSSDKGTESGLAKNVRAIVDLLDAEVIVGLGVVLTGMSDEWVTENFDLDWIIDACEMAYNSNRSIRRIVSGFFTVSGL